MPVVIRVLVPCVLALMLCSCTSSPVATHVKRSLLCETSATPDDAGVTPSVVDPAGISSLLSAQTWADDLTGLESVDDIAIGIASIRAVLPRLEAFMDVDDDIEDGFAQLESDVRDGSVSPPAAGPAIRDLLNSLDIDVYGSV